MKKLYYVLKIRTEGLYLVGLNVIVRHNNKKTLLPLRGLPPLDEIVQARWMAW